MGDLSPHWSISDLTKTSRGANPLTATQRYGAQVSAKQVEDNLRHLAGSVLDELTEHFNWQVNSCYRSPAVNAAVGGASNSAHLVGLACDGHPAEGRGSFADVIRYLAAAPSLPLDRVIFEVRGPTSRWLHVQALGPGEAARKAAFFTSPKGGVYLLTTAEQLAGIAS